MEQRFAQAMAQRSFKKASSMSKVSSALKFSSSIWRDIGQDSAADCRTQGVQSGFDNTDLDQQLKQHGMEKVIVIGLLANTCIESTGRFAMELGYHVTLVNDATAAFTGEMMRAAHELNGRTFAHAILTTKNLIGGLAQV